MTLAFVTENLRAVVTEVEAREKGASHETKEGLPPSGGEPPKHDSVVHVSWKVDNPDSDELRYRVQFRREGADPLARRDLARRRAHQARARLGHRGAARGQTTGVRVDASDEIANPPGDVTHHALESAPVLVDNTPPVFKSTRHERAPPPGRGGRRGRPHRARRGGDRRARSSGDPLAPADGIFDTADETVDADLTPLLPRRAWARTSVAVRAFDAAGNSVVREVETP